MGNKFDTLSDFQKAAVKWQAGKNLTNQQAQEGGHGIYAQKNPEAYLATMTESIADSTSTVQQVTEAYRRELEKPKPNIRKLEAL